MNSEESIRFIKRLGDLLQKGYHMENALSFLQVYSSDYLKNQIELIRVQLRDGATLCASLDCLNLPNEIRSYVYFYEEQGELAEGLVLAASLAQKRLATKKQFQKLLRYPLFLLWGTVVVLIVLNHFIVPHFQALFVTMQQSPPLLTKMFFQFLEVFPYICLAILAIGTCGAFFLFKHFKETSPHDKIVFLLKWNRSKVFVQQLISYYFSLQLGRLLETGMTFQQALTIFENQSLLRFFQAEASMMKKALATGESLVAYMQSQEYYLNELSIVIENGMRTGTVSGDLQQYSIWLFQEMEDKLQKGVVWLQPILLICIGGFVFLLFLVVMLPMFEMIGSLQ